MTEKTSSIPSRIKNATVGGFVTGAEDIDAGNRKSQKEVNQEVQESLGQGGSVDSRINAAKQEIIGDAASDYNTLGKLEDKIQQEASARQSADTAIDGRVETLEEEVGTGGSVDSRISAAVATETTRAQAAEADRYTKSETYTKEEVHNLITTPSQEYVSVTATDQTTAVTDVLPATGAADTTYRVGNWDGTQYNDSVFSEYAWNGSAYIKLSTKSQIGEVYDISANHADTKYANLAAALDSNNGGGVPQSLQKGGMSVKFVQSSDNNYIQARCMAQNFTTDITQWQGVDDKPTAGSENLIESGGVEKELPIKRMTGANNTRVLGSKYKVKGGNTYRIYIKNTDIDMSGVTVAGSNSRFQVANYDANNTYLSGVDVRVDRDLSNYYDVETPSNTDYIQLAMRATQGSVLTCFIEDITLENSNLNKALRVDVEQTLSSTEKKNARKNLGFGDGDFDSIPTKDSNNIILSGNIEKVLPRFVIPGNNNTRVESSSYTIKSGNTYRIYIKNTDIDMSGVTVTGSNSRFQVSVYDSAGQVIDTIIEVRVDKQLENYYDFVAPSNTDSVKLAIRATLGYDLVCFIQDITIEKELEKQIHEDNTKQLTIFEIEGKNNTRSFINNYHIRGGGRYCIYIKNPDIDMSGVTVGSTSLRFDITQWNKNGEIIGDNLVQVRVGTTLASYYEIPTLDNNADYIQIGVRATSGHKLQCILADIAAATTVELDLSYNSLRSGIPSSNLPYTYTGDKIKIGQPNKAQHFNIHRQNISDIAYFMDGEDARYQQGLAIYGNYAFFTYEYGCIKIVDLTTFGVVGSYKMPEGVYGPTNHAGIANFSTVKYSNTDDFPMLYVSSYQENVCYVLRVTLLGCTLVQKIYVTTGEQQNDQWVIDTSVAHFFPDNDYRLIVHHYSNTNKTYDIFYLPEVPQLSEGEYDTVYLDVTKSIDNFGNPQSMVPAGSVAQNGKLFINSSHSSSYDYVNVYDYEQKRMIAYIKLPSQFANAEFEGIALWGDKIVIGYHEQNYITILEFD